MPGFSSFAPSLVKETHEEKNARLFRLVNDHAIVTDEDI